MNAVIVVALLAATLVVTYGLYYGLYVAFLYASVWVVWRGDGQRVLLVTSDSPVWSERIANNLLPRLPATTVVLNWSTRKQWSKRELSVRLFNHFLGSFAHTPSVLVFRPWRQAEVFRFYNLYKQYKHGNPEPLNQLEAQLLAGLSGPN